jgi:hypothetical protein
MPSSSRPILRGRNRPLLTRPFKQTQFVEGCDLAALLKTEVSMPSKINININRAPVPALWAVVVAERVRIVE